VTNVSARLAWSIAQVAIAVVLALGFFTWAPWHGARIVDELPPEIVATLPHDCPAAVNSHGSYACFRWGTIDSNPIGYTALTSGLAILFGLFLFIGLTGRGIWDSKGSRPNKSLERTHEG
jgi:hypothetical protein